MIIQLAFPFAYHPSALCGHQQYDIQDIVKNQRCLMVVYKAELLDH